MDSTALKVPKGHQNLGWVPETLQWLDQTLQRLLQSLHLSEQRIQRLIEILERMGWRAGRWEPRIEPLDPPKSWFALPQWVWHWMAHHTLNRMRV